MKGSRVAGCLTLQDVIANPDQGGAYSTHPLITDVSSISYDFRNMTMTLKAASRPKKRKVFQ